MITHRQILSRIDDLNQIGESDLSEILSSLDNSTRSSIRESNYDQKLCLLEWLNQNKDMFLKCIFYKWLRYNDSIALIYIEDLYVATSCYLATIEDPLIGKLYKCKIIQSDPNTNILKLEAI